MSVEAELEKKLAELPERLRGTREHVDLLNQLADEVAFTRTARSSELALQAEAFSRELDYPKGIADSRTNQAYHLYQQGRHEEALEISAKALEFYRETDDARGQGAVMSCLGLLNWTLGDYEKAIHYGHESLRLFEAAGHRTGLAWVLTAMGGIYRDTGDYEQALSLHSRSLAIFQELGDVLGEGRALTGMGTVYLAQGKHGLALEQHRRSLELFRSIESPLSEARALNDIGAIFQARGELDEALGYHEEALRLRQELGNHQAETTSLIHLGRLFNQKRDPQKALTYLTRALALSVQIGARPKTYQVHEALSSSYALAGEHELALEHHREFHRIKEQVAGEESTTRLKNLEIRHGVEKAEKEAEIERLRHIELAEALEKLKATQAQLIHTAKMASLGDLVAGLVHEIATPVGAIHASADVSRRTLERLLADLGEGSPERARALEILSLNQRTIAGAGERIARLMRSLKSYARLDEAEFQRADVHEGIEAALDLLAPKLQDRIEVVRDFGALPKVECYPSQLHQAFMTILINAVESIDEEGRVTVKSRPEQEEILVVIADTGRGIARERLDKIFEVGFSERGSRIRMHVGLSNVHTIVQRHGGSIEVASELGKGTDFTIRLPHRQSSPRASERSATTA